MAHISKQKAESLDDKKLLAAYEIGDGTSHVAVEMRSRFGDRGYLVPSTTDPSKLDVDATLKEISSLKKGHPERNKYVAANQPRRKIFRIGEVSNAEKMAKEDPLFPGQALRDDGTSDAIGEQWEDRIELDVRRLVRYALGAGEVETDKPVRARAAHALAHAKTFGELRAMWKDAADEYDRREEAEQHVSLKVRLSSAGGDAPGPFGEPGGGGSGGGVPLPPATGPKAWNNAILSAFTTHADLAQAVHFEMNLNLDAIAGGSSLSEVVFSLLEWAKSRGRTEELLQALHIANPGNHALRAVVAELKPAASPVRAAKLTHEQLAAVQDACINLRFLRSTLMSGIDPSFVATLPVGRPPADDLWATLHRLNGLTLADGSVPMVSLLNTALHLAGLRQEARVFRAALKSLSPLRERLKALGSDSDLDAFCLDHFKSTYDRFTNGMDRVAKVTMLLGREDHAAIGAALAGRGL